MWCANWLHVVLTAVAMTFASGLALAAPQTGWWWNPDESGRGFFIESHDDFIYVGGFLYQDDGRAGWMVAGGPSSDPYNYEGRMLAYRHGQTLLGNYAAPDAAADVGSIAIHFADDTHGTITWHGDTMPIERQFYDAGAAEFQPIRAWWWNPDEGGSAYAVEVQGNTLVIGAFMYDEIGNPVWYYSSGKMTSPTSYSGTWLRFDNGQRIAGPYRAPSMPMAVGTLSLEFTAPDQATMTFSDALAPVGKVAVKGARSRAIATSPEFPVRSHVPPPLKPPKGLVGLAQASTGP
jgi:hypothetical protein